MRLNADLTDLYIYNKKNLRCHAKSIFLGCGQFLHSTCFDAGGHQPGDSEGEEEDTHRQGVCDAVQGGGEGQVWDSGWEEK